MEKRVQSYIFLSFDFDLVETGRKVYIPSEMVNYEKPFISLKITSNKHSLGNIKCINE